jgi:hypothetical protein
MGIKKIYGNKHAMSTANMAVIIAVVAVVIAVGIAAWAMMSPAAPKVEALTVQTGSRVQASDRSYRFVLENSGTGDASITRIEIGGVDVKSVETPVTQYPVVVRAGTIVTVEGKVGFTEACVQGAQFKYHIYTAAGHDYSGWLFVS